MGLSDISLNVVKDKDLLIYESGQWVNKSAKDIIIKEMVSFWHLHRLVLNSVDEIYNYLNEPNFNQYIFMIPTEKYTESNKYNEYIIFETEKGERFIESVGSWDVNLSDYALKQDLNFYVPKKEGYELLSPEDKNKLDRLTIDGDNVQISEVIKAENIEDLDDWMMTEGSSYLSNIGIDNLNSELKEKINSSMPNFNVNHFEAVDGTLQLNQNLMSQIHETISINNFNATVGNLNKLLANGVSLSDEIAEIKSKLTWQDIVI